MLLMGLRRWWGLSLSPTIFAGLLTTTYDIQFDSDSKSINQLYRNCFEPGWNCLAPLDVWSHILIY